MVLHAADLPPMDGTHGSAGKDLEPYKTDGKAEAAAPLLAGTEDKLVERWVEVPLNEQFPSMIGGCWTKMKPPWRIQEDSCSIPRKIEKSDAFLRPSDGAGTHLNLAREDGAEGHGGGEQGARGACGHEDAVAAEPAEEAKEPVESVEGHDEPAAVVAWEAVAVAVALWVVVEDA